MPPGHVHSEVKARLRRERLYGLGVFESQLRALEADRNWADYEPHAGAPSAKTVQDDIAKAHLAVDTVKRRLTPGAIQRLCQ